MTKPSANARIVAENLNVSEIPADRSPMHAALRSTEIERQALLLDALSEKTGFNLENVAKSFAA